MENDFSKSIDAPTLKWMRNQVSKAAVTKTLTDLLIEKEKNQPFFLRIVETPSILTTLAANSVNSLGKANKLLSPKLLFHQGTLETIYKIRDIFLEFDEDRSRTLEICELYTMFNSNDIPITEEELIELFTKPHQKKKKIWEYRLTFLDLVEFALDERCQTKFREVMNRIRKRCPDIVFLPLSLEQALEYIFHKGQIKLNMKKINKGIKRLEKIEKRYNDQGGINDADYKTKDNGNIILRKMGIVGGVNINVACKSFENVIELSKEKLDEVNKKIEKCQHISSKTDTTLATAISDTVENSDRDKKRLNKSIYGNKFCNLKKKLPPILLRDSLSSRRFGEAITSSNIQNSYKITETIEESTNFSSNNKGPFSLKHQKVQRLIRVVK